MDAVPKTGLRYLYVTALTRHECMRWSFPAKFVSAYRRGIFYVPAVCCAVLESIMSLCIM